MRPKKIKTSPPSSPGSTPSIDTPQEAFAPQAPYINPHELGVRIRPYEAGPSSPPTHQPQESPPPAPALPPQTPLPATALSRPPADFLLDPAQSVVRYHASAMTYPDPSSSHNSPYTYLPYTSQFNSGTYDGLYGPWQNNDEEAIQPFLPSLPMFGACGCGETCACPGCSEHRGLDVIPNNDPCPTACSTCLDCTSSPHSNNLNPSTQDPNGASFSGPAFNGTQGSSSTTVQSPQSSFSTPGFIASPSPFASNPNPTHGYERHLDQDLGFPVSPNTLYTPSSSHHLQPTTSHCCTDHAS
ncbi:hypothetical protein SISNIDRAFT_489533 [Sistotremastrum niveocremeum HHB9708]|uniref:Uncharacterized protein n=1 Tax=Sistotremastrum niveocremeum HHB9708 TaxID=1314777 RepID=A0A164PWC6_9AGAM|nr:hypothetical protein SISNIDRAFT_489533 [Sistotremastrum niveocremeum HHB9708]